MAHVFPKVDLAMKSKILVGGFNPFNPSEKYEGQLGLLFPIYGKS